ncbi:MAG: sensor histidine kinase, partial [Mycobacterium sp.]
MNPDAPDEWPRGGEWNWLWEAYVVGLAVAAIVAVVLLDDRYPGNVIGAAVALTAMAAVVLVFGRQVAPLPELDWRTVIFVAAVVGLWILALLASPVSVAAVPAIYPIVFSTLPLAAALVVTTIVNII